MAIPIILTSVMGCVFSIILVVASKVMAVPVDETQVEIREILPGANCGACGFAGCDDYSSALAADPENTSLTACVPGGGDVAAKIADILGLSAGDVTPQKAYLKCSGDCNQKQELVNYAGIETCAAAKQFYGGQWSCKSGCLGLGDCVKACPFGAMQMINGIPGIDHTKCVGCGVCANTCPQSLFMIHDEKEKIMVKCSNHDVGKAAMSVCKTACIGCKKCEKECKFDAIKVENGLATIDYDKCKRCGMCAKVCPTGAIVFRRKAATKAS